MATAALTVAVLAACLSYSTVAAGAAELVQQQQAEEGPAYNAGSFRFMDACPDYKSYSGISHPPYSDGPLKLPYQRPAPSCRTFVSDSVESVIDDFKKRMKDKDLARLFENAFPNTLDTTVRWHINGTSKTPKPQRRSPAHSNAWYNEEDGKWEGAQSFIVTGDITAEWLRDSTNQLAQYQVLAKRDKKIQSLILGAINTQAEYVIESPFCNAFQPPPPSGLDAASNGQMDSTNPPYEPSKVFECKYELDSLAAFLSLGNQFYAHTGNAEFVNNKRWKLALTSLLDALDTQSKPTFDDSGRYVRNYYTFQRTTNIGTETLNLQGVGNPLANGTGLVRSAFRPSDDATILGFLVPANAMVAVELRRTAEVLRAAGGKSEVADGLEKRARSIRRGILRHAVFAHPVFGKVFAYEVDGYGGRIFMDDANLPSLLSLPLLGFLDPFPASSSSSADADDTAASLREIYANTRAMILSHHNPYYLSGTQFSGIGGPHIGLTHAWPMSMLVRAMTSENDTEIVECLDKVKRVSRLGLINESVNVNYDADTTRSWFAWANSVFAQTIIDLARRKPHLLFGPGAAPYEIG